MQLPQPGERAGTVSLCETPGWGAARVHPQVGSPLRLPGQPLLQGAAGTRGARCSFQTGAVGIWDLEARGHAFGLLQTLKNQAERPCALCGIPAVPRAKE